MYGRPNYSRNYVAYERVLSKDELITELKKRIDFLEDDQVKRATEHINLMGENMNLRQNLLKAKKRSFPLVITMDGVRIERRKAKTNE